jgi:hypothetical protein
MGVAVTPLPYPTRLVEEGFVPPQFADLHALSAWMCYANFLNRLSLKRIEDDYAGLF